MSFTELQIQLDLNPDNRVNILINADTCRLTNVGYLFIDQEDGQCYLFDEDGNLDDISKVKRIGYMAFFDCTSLTSIKIPDTVKSIGEWAFYNCKHLTSIKIPDTVKSIGDSAFYNCKSLKSITIPSSVKSIGYWAFWKCTSLINIRIPSSVKDIGYHAFIGCTSLKEVVFEGKTMKQVKAMYGYPWGIEDESVIKVES